jgi:hypothetical protein
MQQRCESYFRANITQVVKIEVFTAVTMKNVVFWDVAQCTSCVNKRFRGASVHTRSTRHHIPEDDILHNAGRYVGSAVIYDAHQAEVCHVLQAGMIL